MIKQPRNDSLRCGTAAWADSVGRAVRRESGDDLSDLRQVGLIGAYGFKINQDFRDQDPDRVAIAFKEDLRRTVTNRLGANTGIG